MLYKIYSFPKDPVPMKVLMLQMSANCSWMTYALQISDYYLFYNQLCSFTLQSFSLSFLFSSQRTPKKDLILSSDSNEFLPRI